jgi:hypothetical protein
MGINQPRRKAGYHGKERSTYKASEKSIAIVLLANSVIFKAGFEVYT